jgi:phosphoglycolate phosphatase
MTIVDSSYAILDAVNLVAKDIGKPRITRTQVLEYAAVTLNDFITGIWGECRGEWIEFYREKVAPIEYDRIRPFPEVPQTLTKLREMGVLLAVASNRHDPRVAMDKSQTSKYFDAIVGPIDGLAHKPAPAMLEHLMGRFGAAREETLYVGDADVDLETARAAGVRSVGVARGNFTRAQLEALGAWRVVDALDELLLIVEEEVGKR